MPSSHPSGLSPRASGEPFQSDLATGRLLCPDGQRSVALVMGLVQNFHSALNENFGESSKDLLYRSGFEWGLQEMIGLSSRLQPGKGVSLVQMEPQYVFGSWAKSLRECGHGSASFDFSRLDRGIVLVELQQSAIAAALEGAGQPACHLYAGLFAGAFSFYDRVERHAVEIQCAALGQPACTFIVGPGSDVDAAEAARQKGARTVEILSRLG